MNTSFSDCHHW